MLDPIQAKARRDWYQAISKLRDIQLDTWTICKLIAEETNKDLSTVQGVILHSRHYPAESLAFYTRAAENIYILKKCE